MIQRTEIKIEDGGYDTPASLEIRIILPVIVNSAEQTKLKDAIADIKSVYAFYKPAKNESPEK